MSLHKQVVSPKDRLCHLNAIPTRVQLAGAPDTTGTLPLLPGVYEVTADALPFPYTLDSDTVTVIPESSTSPTPSQDEASLKAVVEGAEESTRDDARAAAEAALTNGSLPVEGATSFGRAGRGFHLKTVTETSPATFDDGAITFRYIAAFGAEQYNGSLNQEWNPVEAATAVTITVPVDAEGRPQPSQVSLDTGALVWGSAG